MFCVWYYYQLIDTARIIAKHASISFSFMLNKALKMYHWCSAALHIGDTSRCVCFLSPSTHGNTCTWHHYNYFFFFSPSIFYTCNLTQQTSLVYTPQSALSKCSQIPTMHATLCALFALFLLSTRSICFNIILIRIVICTTSVLPKKNRLAVMFWSNDHALCNSTFWY